MHLVIAKVDEVYFDAQAVSVTVPGVDGEMTILGEHMPLISTLKAGVIVVRDGSGEDLEIPIEGGVVEVTGESATIIL